MAVSIKTKEGRKRRRRLQGKVCNVRECDSPSHSPSAWNVNTTHSRRLLLRDMSRIHSWIHSWKRGEVSTRVFFLLGFVGHTLSLLLLSSCRSPYITVLVLVHIEHLILFSSSLSICPSSLPLDLFPCLQLQNVPWHLLLSLSLFLPTHLWVSLWSARCFTSEVSLSVSPSRLQTEQQYPRDQEK